MAKGKSASKAVSGKRVKKVLANNAKGICSIGMAACMIL